MSQVLSNLAFIRAIQNTVIQPGESSPVLQRDITDELFLSH